MSITNMDKAIVGALMALTPDQLNSLADWCETRALMLDWKEVQKASAERDAKWKREQAVAEAKTALLIAKLKGIVKPGTRLKMKGCKDGEGIREFIRWDGNNLVCWQILVRRVGQSFVRQEDRTNQVTTHMPDKVQEIYLDGTAMKIKSILK